MRPSWDDVWFEVAGFVAQRSLCSRAKVGCVLVSEDQLVVSASYNGPPPGFQHNEQPCTEWCARSGSLGAELAADYSDCPASHAETNALARADWSRLENGTLYCTDAVCFGCAKQILQTGITDVVHRVTDDMAHRNPEKVEAFLREHGVTVIRVAG